MSGYVLTPDYAAAIIPGPEQAASWGLGGFSFIMFASSNTRALITLLVHCLTTEELDDQIRHAQRTGRAGPPCLC